MFLYITPGAFRERTSNYVEQMPLRLPASSATGTLWIVTAPFIEPSSQ